MNFWLTQVYTGHGNFNKYLNKYKINNNPNCETCNVEDTAKHLLFSCKKFNDIRPKIEDIKIGNENCTKFIINAMKRKQETDKKEKNTIPVTPIEKE